MRRRIETSIANLKIARLIIAALSVAGMLDALYMLAFQRGRIESMACPVFGRGCEVVALAPQARHLGVPNAAIGAFGYAAMIMLAVWSGGEKRQRRWKSQALFAISLPALIASAFLSWEQMARVRAWCFWCLLSTGINAAILPLAFFGIRNKH